MFVAIGTESMAPYFDEKHRFDKLIAQEAHS